MLSPSHKFRVVFNMIILRDINLPYGFCERVTDAPDSLGSQMEEVAL